MLIQHMSDGYSFESFAGKIGKARSTIYKWADDFPDFSDAKSIGMEANLYFWERQGIEGLHNQTIKDGDGMTVNKSINSTVWIFNMKNRHKWRDKTSDEIREERGEEPLRDKSDAELEAIVKRKGNE